MSPHPCSYLHMDSIRGQLEKTVLTCAGKKEVLRGR